MGAKTPLRTNSVSSKKNSKQSAGRRSAVAAHPPAAKRAKIKGTGTSGSLDDNDDDHHLDKYDDEDDYIPVTNGPIFDTSQDAENELFIAAKAVELIEKHRLEFMKRAFSVRALSTDVPHTTVSAIEKICATATSSQRAPRELPELPELPETSNPQSPP